MAQAINIILDKKNPADVIFVEIETDDGKSIKVGRRLEYLDLVKIRITPEDIQDV